MPEPTKTRPGDQPLPASGRECVQDRLIAEIQDRKRLGIERYGSPLMTHNGRDAIRDAREEAVDLAVYLMQVEIEVGDLHAAVQRVRDLHPRAERGDVCCSCSERDYPGYAVPWPCPTITALDPTEQH